MKSITKVLMPLLLVLSVASCSDDDNDDVIVVVTPVPTSNTIVDTAVSNGNFTTLVAALQATGLDATLADTTQTFTVFAPTDAAFALLGQSTIDALLADTDTLSDILTYHVISGSVPASDAIASAGLKVEMVNGDSVGLSLNGDTLFVNTASVTATDIVTDNGIIHVIDAVLLPPTEMGTPTANIVDTAVAAGSFTTLVSVLQATGLDAVLADESTMFTVFAPTDAAFALIDPATIQLLLDNPEVLKSILLQHVVSGAAVDSVTAYTLNGGNATTASGAEIAIGINAETDMLTFGGVNVSSTDIYTTNGVIHVIDAVVVADVVLPTPPMSVVDVAVANGSFTTLAAALQATGLDSVLADLEGEFTVFAPTDAAFALLGDDTIAALLNDTDTLKNILLYHVIQDASIMADGAVAAAQSAESKVAMANGDMAALSFNDSMLYINSSLVSTADVMADNGVIHVIDQVILPPTMKDSPTMSIVEVALASPDFSTLVTALTAADLVTTLSNTDETFTVFAPTNAAFAKIESSTLAGLLGDTDALTKVLLQHVIIGAEVTSLDAFAANGTSVDTASGNDVTVALVNFSKTMNGDNDEVAYDAVNEMLVSGLGGSMPGNTLYVFDNDLGTSGSACNDDCATNWPPVLVSDAEVDNIQGLSLVERDDSTMQAAFMGRPLYYFAGDMAAGDMNGQALGNVWWTVKQAQVSLQIQGSNVTTTDIYTTNGVIHVIDTVITETLSAGE